MDAKRVDLGVALTLEIWMYQAVPGGWLDSMAHGDPPAQHVWRLVLVESSKGPATHLFAK